MATEFLTLEDLHSLYTIIFNLILRHDDRLRLDVAEAIRRILQNPIRDYPLSPAVQDALRHLRDVLLAPPQPEIVSKMYRPSVRLVEDDSPKQTPPKKD